MQEQLWFSTEKKKKVCGFVVASFGVCLFGFGFVWVISLISPYLD